MNPFADLKRSAQSDVKPATTERQQQQQPPVSQQQPPPPAYRPLTTSVPPPPFSAAAKPMPALASLPSGITVTAVQRQPAQPPPVASSIFAAPANNVQAGGGATFGLKPAAPTTTVETKTEAARMLDFKPKGPVRSRIYSLSVEIFSFFHFSL